MSKHLLPFGQEPRVFLHTKYNTAGTFPGQTRTLKDNTHFSTYGAYEVSKCVIEGMKKADLEIVKYLRPDYSGFDPAQPDSFESFKWNLGSFTENEKPDGN